MGHCGASFVPGVEHEPHEYYGLYQRDVYHCVGGPPPDWDKILRHRWAEIDSQARSETLSASPPM